MPQPRLSVHPCHHAKNILLQKNLYLGNLRSILSGSTEADLALRLPPVVLEERGQLHTPHMGWSSAAHVLHIGIASPSSTPFGTRGIFLDDFWATFKLQSWVCF